MINPSVYKLPQKGMDNVKMVEHFLCDDNKEPYTMCQMIVKTKDGNLYTKVKDYYWRCYDLGCSSFFDSF